MLRAEFSMGYAHVLQGSAQGLILCHQHAVCSEAVLWIAAGGCSQHHAAMLQGSACAHAAQYHDADVVLLPIASVAS